ncbi:MAG: thiamine phosphate synthase [Thermovirgaceae bacterium]|nr:thiamine phosphate synthase [Thermovirgaceae bacterium]
MISLERSIRLCVLVDPDSAGRLDVLEQARQAVAGGATAIQLRGKTASARQLVEAGYRLKVFCRTEGVLFIVNDRLDVALACDADGVHLGQSDLPVRDARAIVPHAFVIGASAHSAEEAQKAEEDGADYLGVGAVFATTSKSDATVLGLEALAVVIRATCLPCIGIGGITPGRVEEVLACGACGVAVHQAVVGAHSISAAARAFLSVIERGGFLA